MNKREFVDAVAENLGTKREDAAKAVEAVLETIQATVAKGEDLTILGFGAFKKKDSPARDGRNPATGEPIKIAAKSVPTFKAGADFKTRVESGR
jgi:DNA-binding protein HU-beta